MKIQFSKKHSAADVLVLPVLKSGQVAAACAQDVQDAVAHNIASEAAFKGTAGQTLSFAAPAESGYKKIVLFSVGDSKLTKSSLRSAAGSLLGAMKATGYENFDLVEPVVEKSRLDAGVGAAIIADVIMKSGYSFNKYITDERSKKKSPAVLNLVSTAPAAAKAAYVPMQNVTAGEYLAADMGNEPGNVMFPNSAALMIRDQLGDLPGVKIKVLDEAEMKRQNMNAALAVGQGSANKPCMVVIEYDGTNGRQMGWPLALVGKGVTFDTGGISIKPGDGMDEMKMDMCGAAAVVGAMRALAGRGAKTKIVAICGFAENMPDGKSYRPGDIIKTRSGKTVHVDNTDAEGRLVLCDALDYIQDMYKPMTVVDLATLTGAVVGALSHTYSGVFTPDKSLWKDLKKSGEKSGQPGWRLPLHADFARAVKGKVADLKNIGGQPGASTAAEFLRAFIKGNTAWAHLDIAGTAIPANGIANGMGVRWLNQFVADHYEGATIKMLKAKQAAPKLN